MKKTIFALMALTLVFAVAFVACNKDKDKTETQEEKYTKCLIQKKGWTLSTATSIPAFKPNVGTPDENLFKSFFMECELDDILYFYENKSSILNFGKEKCGAPYPDGKDMSLGNWRLIKNAEVLEFHLPYFTDDDDKMLEIEGKIITLDDNTLVIRIPVDYSENAAKKMKNTRGATNLRGDDGKYDFTFTYKAK